jgi:hypothetical protein
MTFHEVKQSLDLIRVLLDSDVSDSTIIEKEAKLLKVSQSSGLAAECKSEAKRLLRAKEVEVLIEIMDGAPNTPASIKTAVLKAKCGNEEALYEYAGRINAFISHNIESLRSVISLYKSEMEHSKYQI